MERDRHTQPVGPIFFGNKKSVEAFNDFDLALHVSQIILSMIKQIGDYLESYKT